MNQLFQSTTIPVLEQVVGFTQARHGVLAGNVANLDTPGYKTRDLSPDLFEAKLRGAIEQRDRMQPSSEGTRSPGHVPDLDNRDRGTNMEGFRDVKESFTSILYHDESDVAIEKQITEISKNQARHNLALSLLVSQFQLLETAISERA